jgi:hypothetical protein
MYPIFIHMLVLHRLITDDDDDDDDDGGGGGDADCFKQ